MEATTSKRTALKAAAAEPKAPKAVLAIAGSDPSGGAGIQADLKTMITNGVYGMSAITALTAQNTTGVADIMEVAPGFLREQLDCVFSDIRPDAVKIGMISSAELVTVIAETLRKYKAENVVLDPVMVATSGSRLMKDETVQVMRRQLIPAADIITPNIPEAQVLTGIEIKCPGDMERAAELLAEQYGCAVLCKGGHSVSDADDVLWEKGGATWLRGRRIDNPNTHGTGCTLSSAIASNLAKGMDMKTAVTEAKAYISGALAAMLDMGKGSGPLDHAFDIAGSGRFMKRW